MYVPWNIWMPCILPGDSEQGRTPLLVEKGCGHRSKNPWVLVGEQPFCHRPWYMQSCVCAIVSDCTGEMVTGSSPFRAPNSCCGGGQAFWNLATEAKGTHQSFYTILVEAALTFWAWPWCLYSNCEVLIQLDYMQGLQVSSNQAIICWLKKINFITK